MKVVIYWQKKSTAHHRRRIRDRFRLPEGMTIVPPVISEIVVRRLPDTDDADTAHEIHEDAGLKSGIHPKK